MSATTTDIYADLDRLQFPAGHVHDNGDIDLDILFEQMDVDFNDVTDCQGAGSVS